MSDEGTVDVGPNVEMPFPIMTDEGFPWGLKCPVCDRPILDGQPYRRDLTHMYDNGDTMATLTCVYCVVPANKH